MVFGWGAESAKHRTEQAGQNNGCDGNGDESGHQHFGQDLFQNQLLLCRIIADCIGDFMGNDVGPGEAEECGGADGNGHER